MRVFFSAGEASGDRYAGELAARLLQAQPDLEIEGIGGPGLARQGRLIANSSSWGAIGVAQVARIYFRARRGRDAAMRRLAEGAPGLFVPIDYGFMNVRLARFAKRHGWKVLYFSPPGAWRRDRQGVHLPEIADAIVTPFSWSAEILRGMGAQAYWFGHPMRELLASRSSVPSEQRRSVAVLPGSRSAEVNLLLPLLAAAARGLESACEIAVAPAFDPTELHRQWTGINGRSDDLCTPNDPWGVLGRARAGIVCSGTATLEAALCGCPHVVVYRLSPMTALQARLLPERPRFISQPNILLDRAAVPELIQDEATPNAIRENLDRLMQDGATRSNQLAAFEELETVLGPADCLTRTAELALTLIPN